MKLDKYEKEVLAAYDAGVLKPVATKEELARIRDTARATAMKDQRINIRLSADVLERFRATGQGWQTRIDAALKQWLVEHG